MRTTIAALGLVLVLGGLAGAQAFVGPVDNTFGPGNLLTIPEQFPKGNWHFRCAIEDPANGNILTESGVPFLVQ